MIGTIWQDLKHGARMLQKNPGFSFIAMVSIAVGVGANAAMFSLADTLVLRPLTAPRPNEIINVTTVTAQSGFTTPNTSALSYPDYEEVRDRNRTFSSLAAFRLIVASFADRKALARHSEAQVRENVVRILRARPADAAITVAEPDPMPAPLRVRTKAAEQGQKWT